MKIVTRRVLEQIVIPTKDGAIVVNLISVDGDRVRIGVDVPVPMRESQGHQTPIDPPILLPSRRF